jgi:Bifunctional DNA primase/polymerase, N-terminal
VKPYDRATAEEDLATALQRGDQASALAAADYLDHLPEAPPFSLLGAALWYAEHGLPVFPVQPCGAVDARTGEAADKRPYPGTRGCNDATCNPDRIRGWWTAAQSNIGVATGHRFDVIDVDGLTGNITLARDLLDHPTDDDPYHGLPPVWGTVLTPRAGGRHLYLSVMGKPNGAGMGGCDYRGLGGYVLAPPSRTTDGSYVWLRPLDVEGAP